MTIKQEIEKKVLGLFEEYKSSSMSDIQLLESLRREADGSSFLFSFLLEKFLEISYSNRSIALSKGLLKYYLKSEFKEYPDYIFIGGNVDDKNTEIIKTTDGIVIQKGLFIKIIEKLKLNETLNSYIKYLIINEREINEDKYLTNDEIKKYSKIDNVINMVFKEFDKKIESKKRLISF
jgi:hypothetical protein